jgi:hypothetical protein
VLCRMFQVLAHHWSFLNIQSSMKVCTLAPALPCLCCVCVPYVRRSVCCRVAKQQHCAAQLLDYSTVPEPDCYANQSTSLTPCGLCTKPATLLDTATGQVRTATSTHMHMFMLRLASPARGRWLHTSQMSPGICSRDGRVRELQGGTGQKRQR